MDGRQGRKLYSHKTSIVDLVIEEDRIWTEPEDNAGESDSEAESEGSQDSEQEDS